jgi:hypothetical protein
MNEGFLALIILTAFLAVIPALIAKDKGKDFWTWYCYGFLLWIVALIHSLCISREDNRDSALGTNVRLQTPTSRKCPFCAEYVKYEAIVCRYCSRSLPIQSSVDMDDAVTRKLAEILERQKEKSQ